MFPDVESALVITIHTSLADAGYEKLGDLSALTQAEQLLAFGSATVNIAGRAVRMDGHDRRGGALVSYELDEPSGLWRRGRFADHHARTVRALRVPERKATPTSWLLPEEREASGLTIYLANGTLLRVGPPFALEISPVEARGFWGDLFWLQPEDEEAAYWDRLTRFGIPRHVVLRDAASDAVLVEMSIDTVERAAPRLLDLEGYRVVDGAPVRGSVPGETPPPGGAYAMQSGAGEHIGWIIAPAIIDELQQLINQIGTACGEFDQRDSQGGLILDWYDRAAKKFGTAQLNSFTRVRELLKSFIAMHVLPAAAEDGDVPTEIATDYGQWLKAIFADQNVAVGQRWCTFLNGLEQPPPEFGGPQPTAADHQKYRQKVLLQMVDDILQGRYASPVIERPKPYAYSCWAFDFDARNFKMKLRPGNNVLKTLTVTPQGLRLDIVIEHVRVDFEYETQPSDSAGNVALCIFTFGAANVVEIQFGDATVTATDVLLSFDLVPKQVGNDIGLEVTLGSSSHANLGYDFGSYNIFTLGMSQVLSMIFSLADSFEDDLLDEVADAVKNFADDLGLGFPSLFNFADAPDPVLDKPVVVANPGKAQLIGARLKLPSARAPAPPPLLTMPTCSGDFAITLATDYLNGVLAYRLDRFTQAAKSLSFDWSQHLSGESLPDVSLPEGYEPPAEDGKYPTDYEQTKEEWTVGAPVFKSATLAGLPALDDAVGTIHIPITYRLTRTHHAWGGIVHAPDVAPEWWWMGLKGPLGPGPILRDGPLIDLDTIMTARYGRYQQADGQIISQAPPIVREGVTPHINPSPGWHAVDAGGVIVDWYPYAVATDEHINVQLEATLPAHLNLAQQLSFLPTLDLTYGKLQVSVKKIAASSSFPGLQNQPTLFSNLVDTYLQPFAALHTLQESFQHAYANAWLLCNNVYVPFRPDETPFLLVFTVDTMLDPADPKKLCIDADGGRLKVTFRFLESLTG